MQHEQRSTLGNPRQFASSRNGAEFIIARAAFFPCKFFPLAPMANAATGKIDLIGECRSDPTAGVVKGGYK